MTRGPWVNEGPGPNALQPVGDLYFGSLSYTEILDWAGDVAPEVAARREELTWAAHDLLNRYQVGDSFCRGDNGIGLLLASALWSEAARTDGKTSERQTTELALADNFARTLFGPYSQAYPWEDVRRASSLSQRDRLQLHLRYANPDLTRRMEDWFRTSSTIAEVRNGLGMRGQNDSFQVLVLRVGTPKHTKCFGHAGNSQQDLDQYITDLYAGARKFLKESDSDPNDNLPYAYCTKLLGQKYVVIMEPTARVLLEPESVGYADDGKNLDRITSLTQHEAKHAMFSLMLTDPEAETDSYLGAVIEEYDAEVFSGHAFKGEYYDIYRTVKHLKNLKNVDLAAIMRQIPRDNSASKLNFYSRLARELGLNHTAMLVGLITEDDYNFQSPRSARNFYEIMGSNIGPELIAQMTDEQINRHVASTDYTAAQKRDYGEYLRNIREERLYSRA